MSNTGWVCPRCDRVNGPSVKSCECSSKKSQDMTNDGHDGWGFDSDNTCIGCGGENDNHIGSCQYW